jgi:hypothetical protein
VVPNTNQPVEKLPQESATEAETETVALSSRVEPVQTGYSGSRKRPRQPLDCFFQHAAPFVRRCAILKKRSYRWRRSAWPAARSKRRRNRNPARDRNTHGCRIRPCSIASPARRSRYCRNKSPAPPRNTSACLCRHRSRSDRRHSTPRRSRSGWGRSRDRPQDSRTCQRRSRYRSRGSMRRHRDSRSGRST